MKTLFPFLLVLASLSALSWLSSYRSALPTSLDQATLFSPLEILTTWIRQDPTVMTGYAKTTIHRMALWHQPLLAGFLSAHLILVGYLLRRS